MKTATLPPQKKKQTKAQADAPDGVLDVACEFGSVGIGDGIARLPCRFSRSVLTIDTADKCLCGKRLVGRVLILPADSDPGQTYLDGMDITHELKGSFDVKRFGVSLKNITASLSFSIASIDIAELASFASRTGRLVVDLLQDIPTDSPKKSKTLPGQTNLVTNEPWRKFPIIELGLPAGIIKALAAKDIETIGALSDFTSGDKPLTWIPGVGPGASSKIEEAMMRFWESNPQTDSNENDATDE